MINRFKKILFFADGAKGELAALRRSYGLAVDNDAELTVMGVVDEVSTDDRRLQPSIDRLQKTIMRDKTGELDGLIEHILAGTGKKPFINKIVVPGKDYIEVIRKISESKFDLLVKSSNPGSAVTSTLFGNTDLRLLHYCPCPVLILKPQRRKNIRNVLATVDPIVDTVESSALNAAIMDMAISVAELEQADLHLLHVLEHPLPERRGQHKDAFKALEKSLKEDAEKKMTRLVEDYEHVPLTEHLIKGKPHSTIARFIRDQEIDLVVMGSVARSGIPGFFVGNTAEKILDHVDCSVLVLKPRGWKTPVK